MYTQCLLSHTLYTLIPTLHKHNVFKTTYSTMHSTYTEPHSQADVNKSSIMYYFFTAKKQEHII